MFPHTSTATSLYGVLKEQCRSCYSHSDDPVESLSVSARRAAPTRQPEQPVCQTCVIKLPTQEQYLVRDLTSWSASWWVQIKHRDKLCSDVNLLRRNDTDWQFPQNTLDSCKSFLKTHHQFPRLFSSLQAAIFTSIKLSVCRNSIQTEKIILNNDPLTDVWKESFIWAFLKRE